MTPLEEQIEAAFHYRGHVTVTLTDGRTVEGYLFNRALAGSSDLAQGAAPFVELMLKGSGEQTSFPLAQVQGVELTGQDHAAT